MIRLLPHITLAVAIASPAAALTPLPACSGVLLNGYEQWDSQAWGSGFVSYYGVQKATKKAFVALEHCTSGKTIWADTFHSESGASGDLDAAIDALDSYLESDRKYTMPAIKRGLRGKGYKVRNMTMRSESCACNAHYPELRGGRKAFR